MTGRVVDAQIHSARPGEGSWDPDPAHRRTQHCRPERADVIREMSDAGVDAVVLVPPLSWAEPIDNDPWLDDAVADPQRFAVMGRFRPETGPQVADLERLATAPGLLGIRLSIHTRRGNSECLSDGSLAWFWDFVEEKDLPVMVNAPEQSRALLAIAVAHPGLRLIVDHLGIRPDREYTDLEPVVRPVLALAGQANVAVKASALPAAVVGDDPFPTMKTALRTVISEFGADRVFWGSDLSRLPCAYDRLVRFFAEDLDFLSAAERSDILGEALLRWLRWEPGQLPNAGPLVPSP